MRYFAACALLCVTPLVAMAEDSKDPIYRINVISRTLKAINYGYKAPPMQIGFIGTVLLPDAEGSAWVRGRGGATEVDIKVSGLKPPGRFGPGQLTYVLWAVTPQGRPVSLGELIPNHADKAHLKVSTPLQSFAMIVTAEPFFAVAKPSGIIVLENKVLPTTFAGRIEDVKATAELLPRQEFTFDPEVNKAAEGPMVSMDVYEALTALYQAQNALQIAESEGVNRVAPDAYGKAQELYQQALEYKGHKGSEKRMAMIARQAAQSAEDARAIAKVRAAGEAPVQ